MTKKRIYIAGKVTGLPREDVMHKFYNYAQVVQAQGHEPVIPVDIASENDDWHIAMRKCIAALCTCDEIHLLRDWVDSKGAWWEHSIAFRLGIKVVYIAYPAYPWGFGNLIS